MDAVEYLKTKRRLCKEHTECRGCPLNIEEHGYAIGCPCGELERDNMEEMVRRVEKWAKEHPEKTRQSVFLERYPNAKTDEDGVLVICPRSIEQNGCDKFDDHILMCSDCRRKYWSEEVQDDD